ncbi:MAG: hypothetical protein ABJP48_01095 [Erythrobacter sp.]
MNTAKSILALIGSVMLAAGFAGSAQAQGRADGIELDIGDVRIINRAGETRMVCLYKKRVLTVLPSKCYTIRDNHAVVWNRTGRLTDLKVEVSRPRRGIDTLLYSASVAKDSAEIIIQPEDFLTTKTYAQLVVERQPPAQPETGPAEFRVKYCNVSNTSPVWLMIGLTTGEAAYSEGYWKIERGDCTTINYSERLALYGDFPPNNYPLRAMYRAFTTGPNALTWGGAEENEDPTLCVNTQSRFAIDQVVDRGTDSRRLNPCDGEGEESLRFRFGPILDREAQIGRINF